MPLKTIRRQIHEFSFFNSSVFQGIPTAIETLSKDLSLLFRNQFRLRICGQQLIRSHNVTLAAIAAIMVSIVRSIGGYKPPFPIPQTQSAFHQHDQAA
jgi:hypothetical protein